VDAGGSPSGSLGGVARGQLCGGGVAVQGLGEQPHLVQPLYGEGEPGGQLRIGFHLPLGVEGDVQQRAGGRELNAVTAECGHHRGEPLDDRCEIGPPDVAAVHHAEGERLGVGQRLDDAGQLPGSPDQVDVHHVDRQAEREFQIRAEAAEVAGQGEFGVSGGLAQLREGATIAVDLGGGQVEHQGRFVDLEVSGAGRHQIGQPGGVGGQHRVQQVDRLAAVRPLGQSQEGERSEDHRAGREPEVDGFANHAGGRPGGIAEPLVGGEFRDQVVVVGVEPLGQFQRGHPLGTPGHGEVAAQRVRRPAGQIEPAAEAVGHRPQGDRGVEHLVVERQVAHRNPFDPVIAL